MTHEHEIRNCMEHAFERGELDDGFQEITITVRVRNENAPSVAVELEAVKRRLEMFE